MLSKTVFKNYFLFEKNKDNKEDTKNMFGSFFVMKNA